MLLGYLNCEELFGMNAEIELRLLTYIDVAQSGLKKQGISSGRALREVLKEMEITPQEYWKMCKTDFKFKEEN